MSGRPIIDPLEVADAVAGCWPEIVTADLLSKRFGVSRRTVYRWMTNLRLRGAPVRSSAGVGYTIHPPALRQWKTK